MDLTERADDQDRLWNGGAGSAWVDAQAMIDGLYAPVCDLLVDEVCDGPARAVLDVGCGTGGTTVALARRTGPTGGRCVGTDISEPMIAAARRRAARERVGAEFVRADAQRHPFEPATFDVVMSRFGVMFFDDPVRAFANLARAATRDARLRAVVWRDPAENPFMTTAERAAAPLLPDLPARRKDEPGQFGLADRERVASILERAGWSGIDIRPVEADCVLAESDLLGYLTRMGPVGRVLPDVDEPLRSRVVDTVREAFEPFVHGAEVRLTVACWMVAAGSRGAG